jgi:prepilin peptidase CpaA
MDVYIEVFITIVLLTVAIIDLFTRRIPNYITLPFIATGFLVSFYQHSYSGIVNSLLGFIIAFLLFFLFYIFGTLGAGDVKLMMAIGAWLGYSQLIYTSVWIMVVGGFISLLTLMIKVHPSYPFKIIHDFFIAFYVKDLRGYFKRLKENSVSSIPYGVAILLGTVITLCIY